MDEIIRSLNVPSVKINEIWYNWGGDENYDQGLTACLLLTNFLTCCQHFDLRSIDATCAVYWIIVTVSSSMNVYHCYRPDHIGAVK